MKGVIITYRGIEDIVAKEVKEIIGADCALKKGLVEFNINDLSDLCRLCYRGQSFIKVLLLLGKLKISSKKEISKAKKIKFGKYLTKSVSFAVRCKKISKISSVDIDSELGAVIIETIKKEKGFIPKVNLKKPDITFFVYMYDKDFYIGIDFAGFDLDKREYKVFVHPVSLKGPVAYSLIRIAEYQKKQVLLDPFCKDGIIPIEAALFSKNFPVNYFRKDCFSFTKFKFLNVDFNKFFNEEDEKIKREKTVVYGFDSQLRNISAAKKNAKIAGVNKSIKFSKTDIGWLDTKFDKQSVDKIVAFLSIKHPDFGKLIDEFFYQAEFVLKNNGKIVIVCPQSSVLEKAALKYKLKLTKKRVILLSKQSLNVHILKKKSL